MGKDTQATLLVISASAVKQFLPRSTKTVEIVAISNELQEVLLSELTPCVLDYLKHTQTFSS